MTKEMREMLEQLNTMKAEVRTMLNDNKVEDAEAKMVEVRTLEKKIELQKQLDEQEERDAEEKIEKREEEKNMETRTNQGEIEVRAFIKALAGKTLTEEERALVSSNTTDGGGLLVPKDIQTKINELKRQYKSAKDLVGFYPTSTNSGSVVYEDLSSLTDLADMTEMEDLDDTDKPKFKSAPYAVKDYGAILPVSNTLLQDEKADLMGYIGKWFGKKAVRTENKKIFAKLKEGKTAKVVTDWKVLKKLINKDIDPIIAESAIIITNQDGFDMLDSALDTTGRPVLQPDPTNPTVKRFMGKVVHVFSNAELPTVTTKAPIFVGAMEEAVKFVDREVYEIKASSEAMFTKNATAVRCIERFDVLKTDADAYFYGEITVA
ncbi:phage major capsid protein [Clostridium formicaceticum]|uniref:Phage capsid family protein n=1 Tax=Clostridium formicaceticum TaxID=1497 RepID=A0AAC9RKS6_9CLOT|nr:phage major capsid protein [Clostridium formicaceticum]AOY76913.1 hypothetical protein BJL90_14245 [Clostridium formicaceticum]ARE87392.1 Phage capsid family protein [Clostridium formicaceticum]